MKRLLILALILLLVVAVLPFALRLWVGRRYRPLVYTRVEDVPVRLVALVLGAGVYPDGRLTPVLADRVRTAIDLYKAGKVQHLLFSGDNRTEHYNEPQRMFEYALARGVPADAIVLDYAGRRTYDSCYRARDIFRVDQIIVVTQAFHQDRALFLCDQLGLNAIGLAADRRVYAPRSMAWWRIRELPALLLSWWDVTVSRPTPVLGNPIPISAEQPHE
jgi:SanA protein